MSYDFEGEDRSPPKVNAPPMRGDDLETIVLLLELGAIFLTEKPESEFSQEELIAKAMEIGGQEIGMKEADAVIVFNNSKFVKKIGKNRYRLK